MIKSFADKRTRELFEEGRARGLPGEMAARAITKLERIDTAASLEDLRYPHGNRLHGLRGERSGQHSISINRQWRVCFRMENGDAYEVEVCDYH